MLITARHFKARGDKLRLYDLALARRDFWESKEEAWTLLSAKGMKAWDKRVIQLFVVSKAPSHLPIVSYTTSRSHRCSRRSLVFGRRPKVTPSTGLV